MRNPFVELKRLVGPAPLQVGTVVSVDGDTLTVEAFDGGVQQVRGSALLGVRVYHRSGAVEGEAPNLAVTPVAL